MLNYITAYQMMHRTAKVEPRQSVLIHGAAGGVGTALLQLGRLAELHGLITSIRGEGLTSGRPGRRVRFRGTAAFGLYNAGGWLLPGRRVVPYSIQTLKRLKPEWFRQDLFALFELLRQEKVKPLIARRIPLADAKQAHELLGQGGVIGKIVLDVSSP